MSDPVVLRDRMEDAGRRDVTIKTIDASMPYDLVGQPWGKKLWDGFVTSNPIAGQIVGGLSDE